MAREYRGVCGRVHARETSGDTLTRAYRPPLQRAFSGGIPATRGPSWDRDRTRRTGGGVRFWRGRVDEDCVAYSVEFKNTKIKFGTKLGTKVGIKD